METNQTADTLVNRFGGVEPTKIHRVRAKSRINLNRFGRTALYYDCSTQFGPYRFFEVFENKKEGQ